MTCIRNMVSAATVRRHAGRQGGIGIISAIFILVVLAGLGAAMANLTMMQSAGISGDVQGARAYQAARAGIEWGLHRALISSKCDAEKSFSLNAPTLRTFTVTVVCAESPVAVGNPPIKILEIVAVACNEPASGKCERGHGGSSDYVERALQATLEKR
jgi:MSHA biogenesis protein MshP